MPVKCKLLLDTYNLTKFIAQDIFNTVLRECDNTEEFTIKCEYMLSQG